MKANESKPTSALGLAVERLYTVFKGYEAPHGVLDVCTACCMNEELEREMRRLPLRKLTKEHFYQYNDSAKSAVQPADEIKYLVPRMLELLAAGEEIHHSTELALQRIGNCEAGAFTGQERAAIDAFAMAYFVELLSRHAWQMNGGAGGDEIFEVLLMFDMGGIALKPLLARWLDDDSPAATLHYISAGFYDFWHEENIGNAFAEKRPEFHVVMKVWLTDAKTRKVFAQRIMNLDMKDFDQTASYYYGAELTPTDMASWIFDVIAE